MKSEATIDPQPDPAYLRLRKNCGRQGCSLENVNVTSPPGQKGKWDAKAGF
jgi:hypothetical protein